MDNFETYKTAWSPMYQCYVAIKSVYYDSFGEPVITALPQGHEPNKTVLFRKHELTNYCL